MPELPELHGTANVINEHAIGRIFVRCKKSSVSKLPRVKVPKGQFAIHAESRGKELMIRLQPVGLADNKAMYVLCNMGMTGFFQVASSMKAVNRHAHLQFHAADGTVLSFVDQRRFGTWRPQKTPDWPAERGPDPVKDHDAFRRHVLATVQDRPQLFKGKPICEVLHNQSLFNGIGNYLRAEILHRAGVPPFAPAQAILAQLPLAPATGCPADLLTLCRDVPKEVIETCNDSMHKYERVEVQEADGALTEPRLWKKWLRVYGRDDASWAVDKDGRRIWFRGLPGQLYSRCAQKGHIARSKCKPKNYCKNYKTEAPASQRIADSPGEKVTRRVTGKRSLTTALAAERAKRACLSNACSAQP